MSVLLREPTTALRRIVENAALLIFASLLVVSLAMERHAFALLWCGALLVVFAQAWEGRAVHGGPRAQPAAHPSRPRQRRALLRWLGLMFTVAGAALLA